MVRKFLYIMAGVVIALLALLLALRLWSQDLTELAFVPTIPFETQAPLPPQAWNDPAMWVSHPQLPNDPAAWLPEGVKAPTAKVPVAVFFIHPTSFVDKSAWNAPLHRDRSAENTRLMVQAMASPFNAAQSLWAPRYRQATIGALLTDKAEGKQALDLAYGDVLAAFDAFLAHIEPEQPIALAGHSQGAWHLRRLLQERVKSTPLAQRVIGAWLIGWPLSLTHDLPEMGLPACTASDQSGCISSWLSMADPAETDMLLKVYDRHLGLDGQKRGGSAFLCTNPLSGISLSSQASAASDNLGTLVPDFAQNTARLEAGKVPAQCGGDHILHIGAAPDLDLGPYVLPGNNYHLYDIPLFWANLRADFERRAASWRMKQAK